MMRAFTRWLFMRTHRAELLALAREVRAQQPADSFSLGHRDGVIVALETLELLT